MQAKTSDFEILFNSLNVAQKEAVNHIEGPVMVVAGPGTGKTEILAARIANILKQTDTKAHNILCLTYTNAGVVAMRERLLKFIGPLAYRVNIHTFHSLCNEIIQFNGSYFGYNNLKPASDLDKIEIMQQLMDELPSNNALKRLKGEIYYDVKNLLKLFNVLKEENISSQEVKIKSEEYFANLEDEGTFIYKKSGKGYQKGDIKQNEYNKEKLNAEKLKAAVDLFETFNAKMLDKRLYDFTDMILWVINAFKTDPDFLLTYQERFQYLLVDEFQDTNGSQNQLIDLLMSFFDVPNLFVVGDDDQSIYRFQGANVGNILNFAVQYQHELKTTVLTDNYRSSQLILNASRALINLNSERIKDIDKNLVAQNEAYANCIVAPRLLKYFNPIHEAIGIGQQIEELHKQGVPFKEIAILYKNHKQIEILSKYFQAKNIPISSKRRVNILNELLVTKLIKLLTYLNSECKKPHSAEDLLYEILSFDFYKIPALELAKISIDIDTKRDHWRVYLNKFVKDKKDLFTGQAGLDGMSELKRLVLDLEYWIEQVNNITVPQLVEKIIAKGGILSYVMQADDKRWQMQILRTFFDFIKEEAAKNPRMQLSDLLKTINRYREFEVSLDAWQILEMQDSVNLITTHSSKGLEFEHVFIINCTDNGWFNSRSESDFNFSKVYFRNKDEDDDEQENRRLFYVAMTRAKKGLTMSYHQQNLDTKPLEKLRFIAELETHAELVEERPSINESLILEFESQFYRDQELPDFELIDHQYLDTLLASYTLSATHLNSYLNCPTNFYFNQVLHVPSAKSEGASFGTAIHNALEKIFIDMQNHPTKTLPTLDILLKYFEQSMYGQRDSFTDDTYTRRLEYGKQILPKYYAHYADQWQSEKIFSVEKNIQHIELKGVPIKGKLDRIVFEGNSAYVVDFKTGNFTYAKAKCNPPIDDPNPDKKEQVLGGDYWRQMVFYNLLINNNRTNEWTMTRGEMNFVEPDKFGNFSKVQFAITPQDADIVTQQITDTYSKIKAHEFTQGCNDAECYWCNFVKYYLKKQLHISEQLPGSSEEGN
ncbi:MAG: ATP-dependent helicase [Bacteroidetes bacterium]|nr:ATP-dependent helicase [Bacteroidota bacterium]